MRRAAAQLLPACLIALSVAFPARAEPAPTTLPLSSRELDTLKAGGLLARALNFDQGGGHYVGGVSYQVVDASPELVLAVLSDVRNWPEALPRTKRAQLIEGAAAGLSRVELVQGGSVVQARYTVVLERAEAGTIRFWLDPSRPHDIEDAWGFFRVQPLPGGRSLITVGAALDVGDGLVRLLFEDKVAQMMLGAPRQIRAFVEPRALAWAGTSGR
jgi:hypothetical protein